MERKDGKQKAEVPGLLSPDTSALFLLYSIFDRNIELKPVGWEQDYCSSAIENHPFVQIKIDFFISAF